MSSTIERQNLRGVRSLLRFNQGCQQQPLSTIYILQISDTHDFSRIGKASLLKFR